MNDTAKIGGIGISSLCLLWGIVTQCLSWAGVLQWPWFAIWGPVLFIVGIWVIAFIVAILVAAVAVLINRR